MVQIAAFAAIGACLVVGGVVLTWRAPTWVQWWHRACWVLAGLLLLTVPLAAPTPEGDRLAPYVRPLAERADLVVLGLVGLCAVTLLGAAVSHLRDDRHHRSDAVQAGEPVHATRLAAVTTGGLVAFAGLTVTALLVAATSMFDLRFLDVVTDQAEQVAASAPGRALASALGIAPGPVDVTVVGLLGATVAVAVTAGVVQRYRCRRADRDYREHLDYFAQRVELEQARVMGQVRDALQSVSSKS
ncbi:MAG: hypothetical protein ACRCYX_14720 [Dermatophilaceae bacterium]